MPGFFFYIREIEFGKTIVKCTDIFGRLKGVEPNKKGPQYLTYPKTTLCICADSFYNCIAIETQVGKAANNEQRHTA